MNIDRIRKLFTDGKVKYTEHCTEQMLRRLISRDDIKSCIMTGEIIEDYPDDYPYQSCLIYGHDTVAEVLHTVAAEGDDQLFVVTAYHPNTDIFEDNLKTRRKK